MIDAGVLGRLTGLELEAGEFIAARSDGGRDYTEYRDDPVRFAHEVLDYHPWGKQVEMAESVLRHKRTAVRGAHGMGKDSGLGWLKLWAAFAREMVVLAISATERQLIGQLWAEMTRMWDRAGLPGEMRVGWVVVDGDRRINAMTSGSTSNLTGWHNHRGTGVFVAISESQAEQVGAAAFDAATGNTAGAGSRVVVVGNPVAPEGRFFEAHRNPAWHQVHISALDHPNVVEGRVVIPGGPDPKWPQDVAAEHGEGSAFYVSRVLGEFPLESEDQALPTEAIEEAFERYGTLTMPDATPFVLGVDPAGPGEDAFAVTVWRGMQTLEYHTWRKLEAPESCDRIIEVMRELRRGVVARVGGADIESVSVDSIGIGHGVVGILQRRFRTDEWFDVRVLGVNVAKRAGDAKRFVRRKDELVWQLREDLVEGRVALKSDEKLREELKELRIRQTTDGRIETEPKDKMRARLGRSPDLLDSVLIATSPRVRSGPRFRIWGEPVTKRPGASGLAIGLSNGRAVVSAPG